MCCDPLGGPVSPSQLTRLVVVLNLNLSMWLVVLGDDDRKGSVYWWTVAHGSV